MTNNSDAVPDSLNLVGADSGHKEELCNMLQSSDIFGDLSRRKIETLAKYVHAYTADEDTAIFVEGEHAGFMCIVIKGRLKVLKDSGGGRSKVIADVDPGKSLGEMSMIDGLPHSATTVAVEPVTLVTLTREDFSHIVEENPKLAAKILWRFARIMSQRLRNTTGMLVDSLDLLTKK